MGEDLPCNATDHQLFAASTTLTIGNGENIAFWSSAWIQGMSPKDVAPSIYKISKRKNRSLKDALAGNARIRDLDFQSPSLSASHFIEFVQLWKAVQQVGLNPSLQDEIN